MNCGSFRFLSGVALLVSGLAMGVPRPIPLRAQAQVSERQPSFEERFNLVAHPETRDGGIPPIDPNGPSLVTVLQEQLGLKLVSAKGPVDVLVIDSVEHPTPD